MRTRLYRPMAPGCYPALIFYSEIFQETEPVGRSAAMLAGHGYLVAVPEVFHELNPIGTVLGYDDAGKDKGNLDKITKPLEQHDDDTVVLVEFLQAHPQSTGKIGTMGICLGGHLACRAAINPAILAAACLYATDIHSNGLPAATGNNTFDRLAEIQAEMMMVWGHYDPHIPPEGRLKLYKAFQEAGLHFTWHEFNAQHAFLRDEGERYDPELSLICYQLALRLFGRKLGDGDLNEGAIRQPVRFDC
jgi:carboxymethylenebutenolidase